MNQAVSPEPPVTQATERVRVMTLRRALGAAGTLAVLGMV